MEDVSWLVPELVVMVVSVVVVVVSMGTDTGLLFVFSVCVSVPSWLIVAVEVAVGQDRVETESPLTSVRSSEWLGSMMLRVSGVVTVWLVARILEFCVADVFFVDEQDRSDGISIMAGNFFMIVCGIFQSMIILRLRAGR